MTYLAFALGIAVGAIWDQWRLRRRAHWYPQHLKREIERLIERWHPRVTYQQPMPVMRTTEEAD